MENQTVLAFLNLILIKKVHCNLPIPKKKLPQIIETA